MCGVIAVKNRKTKAKSVLDTLLLRWKAQEERGRSGFGFIAVKKDTVIGYERDTTEDGIRKKLELYKDATEFMFHHRIPTSTPNTYETAHPVYVTSKLLKSDYYLIHNGHINNCDERKAVHEALGIEYSTALDIVEEIRPKKKHKHGGKITKSITHKFLDTEALAWDFALWNEKVIDSKEIPSTGGIALMAYEVDKTTNKVKKFFYGHNDISPMRMDSKDDIATISSLNPSATAETPTEGSIFCFDFKSGETTEIKEALGVKIKRYVHTTWNNRYTDPQLNTTYAYSDKSEHISIAYMDLRPLNYGKKCAFVFKKNHYQENGYSIVTIPLPGVDSELIKKEFKGTCKETNRAIQACIYTCACESHARVFAQRKIMYMEYVSKQTISTQEELPLSIVPVKTVANFYEPSGAVTAIEDLENYVEKLERDVTKIGNLINKVEEEIYYAEQYKVGHNTVASLKKKLDSIYRQEELKNIELDEAKNKLEGATSHGTIQYEHDEDSATCLCSDCLLKAYSGDAF